MGRQGQEQFNAKPDTGRMGFRRVGEPVDERPLLLEDACRCAGCRKHQGFWRDTTERLTYENAVEANPRLPGEGPMAYVQRISEIASGQYGRAVQSMPHVRQSRRERDAALAKLRGQADGLPSGTEDYVGEG